MYFFTEEVTTVHLCDEDIHWYLPVNYRMTCCNDDYEVRVPLVLMVKEASLYEVSDFRTEP